MSKKRKPNRPTTASVPAPPPAVERSEARTSPRWAWVLAAFAAGVLLAAVAWQLTRAPTPPAPSSLRRNAGRRELRRQSGLQVLSRAAVRRMDLVAARARNAARDRGDRARRLQRREVHLPRRHIELLQARRQVLRPHRRPRRQARRLRSQVHLRRRAAAAVPGRAAGRTPAGARGVLGYAAQGCRRPALVQAVPGREDRLPRRTALDTACAELELHVRGLSLEPGRQGLRRDQGRLRDALERDLGRLRVVSRPRLGARRVGRQQVRRSGQGADGAARRAARRQLEHRPGDRQRDAQPRAHERARDRGLRAVPCAARADRRGLSRRCSPSWTTTCRRC